MLADDQRVLHRDEVTPARKRGAANLDRFAALLALENFPRSMRWPAKSEYAPARKPSGLAGDDRVVKGRNRAKNLRRAQHAAPVRRTSRQERAVLR